MHLHKLIILFLFIFTQSVLFGQAVENKDSMLLEVIKKNSVAERDWLSFNKILTKNYFETTGDTILEEVEVLGATDVKDVWLKKLKSSVVTFYYLTPSDNEEDDWVSVSLYSDQFERQIFGSSKYRITRKKYGRCVLYTYTLEIKGNYNQRFNVRLEQNCSGRWVIVTNRNAKMHAIAESYSPEVPKETIQEIQNVVNTSNKIVCPDCNGKGTVVEETDVNCASCWGKGTKSCTACGGGGRLYTKDRSRSEYCSFCHGSGTKYCTSCNGTGKKSTKLPKKCNRCKGTKFINKEN